MAKICRNNRLHFAYCSTDNTLNTRCVRQSPPTSYVCVVSYLVPWLFLLFWAQCTHAQLNPFYHPFYSDVTHVRKDTRPSPALLYWKRWKAGWGLGMRLWYSYSTVPGTYGRNRPSLRPSLIVRMSTFTSEREGEFCMGC